jgi:hypothetical protein
MHGVTGTSVDARACFHKLGKPPGCGVCYGIFHNESIFTCGMGARMRESRVGLSPGMTWPPQRAANAAIVRTTMEEIFARYFS